MDGSYKLPLIEPDETLDARVRRRMCEAIEETNGKSAAPFLPLEQALYTAVAVAYALYAAANAVHFFCGA